MQVDPIKEAIKWLEKANADLQPELLTAQAGRDRFADYSQAERLVTFGKTMLASKVDDEKAIASMSGTSVGKAKQIVETAKVLQNADLVRDAFSHGEVSFDQAQEIGKAEKAAPGSSVGLLDVARSEGFHVLRDASRKVVLEAEQHRDLTTRQKEARTARHHTDDLGMVNIHLRMTPVLGTAIVNRAESEARRLQRAARAEGREEPFERHLLDSFGAMLSGAGTRTKPRRPEVTVLVSHGVATRGWTDVKDGEVCKIPGVGPVSPQEAKEIARDAFLTGVFFDGKDLRHLKRWTRNTPIEVLTALELGEPPDFDGIKCTDCGNRFRNENDHVHPRAARGVTSLGNLRPRCYSCHKLKTERDRKAGLLRPRERPPPDP